MTGTADASTETVLWQQTDDHSKSAHLGGAIAIAHEPIDANDPSPYKLYITTREEFEPANSQDLTHDDGKVHRINLTDGSIPTDNPYYDPIAAAAYTPEINTSSSISTSVENLALDAEGVMTTIYSYGLRNPFRASYDQESGKFFIGDVGGNNNDAYEEINIASPGANFGWPSQEGYHTNPDDPGSPFLAYNHLTGPGIDQVANYGAYGAAVTGGIVYRGDNMPEEYYGDYFYADWVRKWIRVIDIDWSGDEPVVVSDQHYLNSAGQVLDLAEGPDGSLYYLTTFQTGNVNTFTGAVHRLTYDASNSAPIGTGIVLDPSELASTTYPHTVTFEADVSDPDGDTLTYLWSFGDGDDLDGDGNGDTATSTEENPTWTYTQAGSYVVELLVTDENGATTVFTPQTIEVGNAPTVSITPPTQGLTFRAGDTITVTGSANDLEDGDISFDANWSVQFLHNEHTHPLVGAELNDADGLTLTIDTVGHDYYSTTGFIVALTSTDSDGLTQTESILLTPEESVITFDLPDNVPGYALTVDGIYYNSDTIYDNIINFEHVFTVPESYVYDGYLYEFSHWSDDPSVTTAVRNYVVLEDDVTIAPVYNQTVPVNQAIQLGGASGVLSSGLVVGSGGADFTVEGWIYFADGAAVSKADSLFLAEDESGEAVDLNFHGGVGRVYSRDLRADLVTTSTVALAGEWHHYALTRDAGVLAVYVDGALEGTAGQTFTDALDIQRLGGSFSGGTSDLEGALDEIRIWDTARSGAQIAANYQGVVDDATAGLTHRYAFEGDADDSAGTLDLSTGGRSFTNDGAPITTGEPANQPPVAQDDNFALEAGYDPVLSHLHILDNDSDADGALNLQMVEIVSGPAFGTVEIMDTAQELADRGLMPGHYGHAEYVTNDPAFEGIDSFTYRVQDDEGDWSNIATATITVGTPPNEAPGGTGIVLDTGEDSGNTPHSVSFETDAYDPEGGALSYLWDFGDGTTSTEAEPTHNYTTDGTYTVTLTATDIEGASTTYATASITTTTVLPGDNQAIQLGGASGVLSSGLVVGSGGADFTVEGWIYFADGAAVSKADSLFLAEDESGEAVDLNFHGGVGRVYSRDLRADLVTTSTVALAGEWHHYALTRDAGVLAVYVDGALEGTAGQTFTDALDIQRLGGSFSGGTSDLEGALDEIRIWDTARSGAQIAANYQGVVDDATAGLTHRYAFEGDADDSAGTLDLSTGGRSFTNDGAPITTGEPANQPPVAQDDNFALEAGYDPVLSHLHILDNDSDADGALNLQMVEIVSGPAFGTVEIMDTAQELADRGLMPGHYGHAEYVTNDPAFEGIDSFTYRVQDDEGDWSNIATATITVGTPPNEAPGGTGIVLDTGEDSGNTPHSVSFETDAYDPEGGALSYLWDFGDGTTSTEAEPTHNYTTDGTYTVTLTATDIEGASTTYATASITTATVLPGDNQAIQLDGASGVLSSGLVVGSGGADFTVEGWIYFADGAAVSKADSLFLAEDESGEAVDLNFHGGVGRVYSRDLRADLVTTSTVALAGEWHHYALTRDAGVLAVYVDGALEGTAGQTFTDALDIQRLGGSFSGGTSDLEGALDEIRIWDTARSGAQIAANYQGVVDDATAGLTHRYAFEGDADDSAGTLDLSTGGRSFTNDGAPITTGEPANQPPVAQDDNFALEAGYDPVLSHLHILDNDSDADGALNLQMVEIVSGPAFGTVEIMDTAQELADRGLMPGHYGHAEYVTNDPAFEGIDSFTYRVQDDEGDWSNIATATITVGTPPNEAPGGTGIVLDTGEDSGNTPHSVSFETDAYDPEGGALSYLWDFGDGTTSTEAEPTHNYTTDGTYTVTLTATDIEGASTTYATASITTATVLPGDNQAIQLDGTSGGLSLIGDLVLGTAGSDFTIEGWIQFEEGSAVSNYDGLFLGTDENGQAVDLNFFGGVGRFYSRADGDLTKLTTSLSDGEWNHVALTRDAGSLQLYLNGVEEGTASAPWLSEITVSDLGRGFKGGASGSLEGALDEVRVWDAARSASEILATYDVAIASSANNLVNNFKFDQDGEDSAGYLEVDVAGLSYTDGFDFI